MSIDLFYDVFTVLFGFGKFLPSWNSKIDERTTLLDKEEDENYEYRIIEILREFKISNSYLNFDDVFNLSCVNNEFNRKLKSFYKIRLLQKFKFVEQIKNDSRFKSSIRMFEQFQYCKLPDFVLNLIDLEDEFENDEIILFIPVMPYLHEYSEVEIRKMNYKNYEIFPNVKFYKNKEKIKYNFSDSIEFCHYIKSGVNYNADISPKTFPEEYFEYINDDLKGFLNAIRSGQCEPYDTIFKMMVSQGFYPLSHSKFQIEMEKRFHLEELTCPIFLRNYMCYMKAYKLEYNLDNKGLIQFQKRFRSVYNKFRCYPEIEFCERLIEKNEEFLKACEKYLGLCELPEDNSTKEFLKNIMKYGNKETLNKFCKTYSICLTLDFTFSKITISDC